MRRKIWQQQKAGSLESLRLIEEDLPPPAPGEARVRVQAVGLNFADVFACLGLYSATPRGSFVPGLEFSGVVEELGPPADRAGCLLEQGSKVMGTTRFGAYATILNADARYLEPLPPGWSSAEGAAFPVQALTAWYALVELGRVGPGQEVLVHSAAGGVGLNALAIIAKKGAHSVATVGRPEKVTFLREHVDLPADRILLRDARRFESQLGSALEHLKVSGFDLILDAIGGRFFHPGYRALRPGGRLVSYGAASFMPAGKRPNHLRLAWRYLTRPRLDPLKMIHENRSVLCFNLIWLWDRIDELRRAYGELRQLGLGPPHVGSRFPFASAPEAVRRLQSGRTVGKVVLEP